MKKWHKILIAAGCSITVLGSIIGIGLQYRIKDGNYLVLKQKDKPYTLHAIEKKKGEHYFTSCGMNVYKEDAAGLRWIYKISNEHVQGNDYLESCFLCVDKTGVESVGYDEICPACFPNGYESIENE